MFHDWLSNWQDSGHHISDVAVRSARLITYLRGRSLFSGGKVLMLENTSGGRGRRGWGATVALLSALKESQSMRRRVTPWTLPLFSHWTNTCRADMVSLLLTSLVTRHSRSFSKLSDSFGVGCHSYVWEYYYWHQFMILRLLGRLAEKVPSAVHRVVSSMKPQVVFVLGGPGAGKGTQCAKIVEVRNVNGEQRFRNLG